MKSFFIKTFLSILFSLFLLTSYGQINCKDIPAHFNTYDEAKSIVKSAKFAFSETTNTSKKFMDQGSVILQL